MNISHTLVSRASDTQLQQAQWHLTVSFLANIAVNIINMHISSAPGILVYLFAYASYCTGLYVVGSIYLSAYRIGFRHLWIVLALLAGFFFPILALILFLAGEVLLYGLLRERGHAGIPFGKRKA